MSAQYYMFTENFESAIKNVYIFGLEKELNLAQQDKVDYEAHAKIEFTLEPEYRSWGCKGIYCDLKKLDIVIEWETETQNGTLEIDGMQPEYEKNIQAKFLEGGEFSIDACDIDLKEKTIELY